VIDLYTLCRRHVRLLILLTAFGAVFGIWAVQRLPSGIYPEVDFPRIVVVAEVGDAAADVMVATVTRPLEAAIATVPGVRRVRSKTSRGAVEVNLTFAEHTDMARALAMVQARTEQVRGELGPGAQVEAQRLTPVAFPVLTFNLTGPLSGADLYDLAENVVRPVFSRVDGAGRVEVLGGDRREEEVIVNPAAAAALRLDAPSVAARITDFVHYSTAGHLTRYRQAVTVEADTLPLDAETLGELPVAVVDGSPVPLSAIAEVRPGVADRTAQVSGPGGETVLVSISRMEGASTPAVADAALAAAASLDLPAGVHLDPVYDQASLVNTAIGSVRDAIAVGIVLCVLVLAIALRDWRAGLIAGATVPLTLAITFGAMYLGGQTLNLMSLGGMAVAIGLVVDDAIVVVEAIARHREEGKSGPEASREGVAELLYPVIGRTLTTVVVFSPMSLVSGVVGRFFGALSWTLAAAVLISLVLAVTLVPLAAGRWLAPRASTRSKLDVAYGRVLRASLRHRGRILVASVALGALGTFALTHAETGFLPAMDEGGFVLDYFLPAGTSLDETSQTAARIEAVLAQVPEVRTWSRRTGAELGPAAATESNQGDIMVRLKQQRDRGAEEVMADVRARVQQDVPQARIELIQVMQDVLNDLAGASHPVEIKLYSTDPQQLPPVAAEVASRLKDIPGLADLYGGVEAPSPSLRFDVDQAAAARLLRTPADIGELLGANLRGVVPARIPWLDRRIDVRLRAPDAVRFSPEKLAALPLVPGDPDIPVTTIAAVARPSDIDSPTRIGREDLRPVVIVTGELDQRDLGSLMADVRAKLADLSLPAGVSMEIAGAWAQQQTTFKELLGVFVLAVAAVGVVLVGQFRTLRLPLLILATTPVALVGAVVTLWAFGIPLNASSAMGAVLLVGLVVKNGILLLEYAQGLQDGGLSALEAVVAAGERRLRPILLTTVCTVFGLLPLALGVGSGADLQRPLAVAVIGGLSVSTAVSLFLLPTLAVGRSSQQ